MPKKVRELKAILSSEGFVLIPKRGKGSHSVWYHPLLAEPVILSGKDGADADRYQEKDVRVALKLLNDARKSQEEGE